MPFSHRFIFPLVLSLLLSTTLGSVHAVEKLDFNKDVRPILSDNCFACHGPDDKKIKGDLRLDSHAAAIKGGKSDGPAIVVGKPDESAMIKRIMSTDEDEAMPPKESAKPKLKPEQVEILRRWIKEGAEYRGHWAFIPPVRPTVPAAEPPVANPIDAFIRQRLQQEGLTPAAEADKATLIRRVTLDLIGLPPTAEEVSAFLADTAPNAFEKVVDRLLASPRYGERMAMPWLDIARFADSNGFQADGSRQMWPWRDWVIKAFNENLPFDQFTIQQLAGDLLPNATQDQILASGFNRNHRLNGEGGLIAAEWFVETVIDRVETTCSTWMALTYNCCRCHDHKYDPISQKNFYEMFGYFNSVDETGILQGDSRNTEPLIRLAPADQVAKQAELAKAMKDAEAKVKAAEKQAQASQAAWEKEQAANVAAAAAWKVVKPETMKSAQGTELKLEDDVVFASGAHPATDTYTLTFKTVTPVTTAVRLELLPDDRLPSKGPGRHANGNPIISELKVVVAGKEVPFKAVHATFDQPDWESPKAFDGNPATGWAIHPQVGKAQSADFELQKPLELPVGTIVGLTLLQNYGSGATLGKFRLALTASPKVVPMPAEIATILAKPAGKRTKPDKAKLDDFYQEQYPAYAEAKATVEAIKKQKSALDVNIPTSMVMKELDKPRDAFLLKRGQYDAPGDKVERKLPEFLPGLPAGAPNNRLGLAQWLVSPNHPLTARVWVNRTWEKFFGIGLCKTSENFGSQSEWPSHPELLDWLATEFIRLGWDMKALQKTMLLSATYRQATKVKPQLLEKDPENRLLARGPRLRLSGETLRDQALAVSGLLVDKIGGPSVRPYMPEGVWDETSRYGDLRNYQAEKGEGLYRRTLYTIWKRSAGPPTLQLFDAPTRDICTLKRSRTNTPLQALALLNEVTFVEAARVLAEQMLAAGGSSPEARITWVYEKLLARKPRAEELQVLTTSLAGRLAHYEAHPEEAAKLLSFGERKSAAVTAELAAYTLAANVILNLDEAITRE